MRITRRQLLEAAAAGLVSLRPAGAQPARPRRKDSFFGLHFDLHPNNRDVALGRDLTPEMADRLLAEVKPDYIQYDCKGHVGYMGYASAVSTPASNIVKDSLAIWRQATARNGAGLYIHFSGVWDSLAIQQHPEWAAVRADGTPDPNATSTFGPYVDQRMIPQLEEAIRKYDLDGAWVDGECWAVRPDYSKAAAEAFTRATGIRPLPKGPGDRGWQEFLDFHRARFREYVKHYIDEIHRFRPSFQVASNWLYTTYVPERPELPVDFISGDYLGNASISTARLEARYLSAVQKPWDLMAWGFQHNAASVTGHSHKSAVQLQQEAAVVLAQGGGFQIYYQPTRAGWIDERNTRVMAQVARFCRARQAVSHQTEAVPGIGVVFSSTSLYTTANKMFGGWGANTNPARGIVDALVANQYSVDVIPEWRLAELAGRYGLIVLPDWPNAGLAVKDTLTRYVRGGGKLLLVGAENAALFAPELPVTLSGDAAVQQAFVAGREVFANVSGHWQNIEPGNATVIEQRYPSYDSMRGGVAAATVSASGSGQVAAIYGPLGSVYAATHAAPARDFLKKVVEAVYTPALRVEAPPVVEVALRRKGQKTLLHLVNSAEMQVAADYAVIDYIPPVGPVKVSLKLEKRPGSVTLEPGGKPLAGEWNDGTWNGTVDRVEIHSVVVFGEGRS